MNIKRSARVISLAKPKIGAPQSILSYMRRSDTITLAPVPTVRHLVIHRS